MAINKMAILTLIIAFSIVLFFSIPIYIMGGGNSKYYISDFNLYKKDFQIIANKMLTLSDLSNSVNGDIVSIDFKNHQMSCKLNGKIIEMTEEENNALKNVDKAFDSSTPFVRIIIYKNRVTFCTDGNLYAVAYLVDNSKPQFMSAPTEPFEIKTKKIDRNWYHIASK